MIVSSSKKFVFTCPTRSGAISAQKAIISSGILKCGDYHSGTSSEINNKSIEDIALSLPDWYFKNKQSGFEKFRAKIELTYATPETLLERGIIDESAINEYEFVSVLRNPIDRFFSAWVSECKRESDTIDDFFSFVNNKNVPNIISAFPIRKYFTINENKIKNVTIFLSGSINKDVCAFVKRHGYDGKKIKCEKTNCSKYPSWSSKNYNEWMSNDIVKKISLIVDDDVSFFTNTLGFEI